MDLRIIAAPLVGGVIGYITNDIAIRMLFRPRRAYYIGKFKIPFTPGLIPSQKNRIARSIARVISTQLLDNDTMKATLLSDGVIEAVRAKAAEFMLSFRDDGRTIEEAGVELIGAERFGTALDALESKAAQKVTEKVIAADIGSIAVTYAIDSLRERFGGGLLGMFLTGDMIDQIGEEFARNINTMIEEKAPSLLRGEISKLSDEVKQKRLSDIAAKYADKIPVAADYIVELYKRLISENIGKMMRAVDIEETVYNKVAAFDAAELERMIFGIMKRELRAIVYLGALLGFIMGFVNVAFLYI